MSKIITTQKQINNAQEVAMKKVEAWINSYVKSRSVTKQYAIEHVLGTTRSTYKRYVRGDSYISVEFLLKAAMLMHTTVEDLVLDTDDEPDEDEAVKLWAKALRASFPQVGIQDREKIGKHIMEIVQLLK